MSVGENCIAAGRLFVEETIYDEFLERVVAETKKMKIGNPLDRSVQHGPQNHKAHLDKLLEYCQTGLQEVRSKQKIFDFFNVSSAGSAIIAGR